MQWFTRLLYNYEVICFERDTNAIILQPLEKRVVQLGVKIMYIGSRTALDGTQIR